MPLDEFTDKAWAGLLKGEDEVYVGAIGAEDRFSSIARQRREACDDFTRLIRSMKK